MNESCSVSNRPSFLLSNYRFEFCTKRKFIKKYFPSDKVPPICTPENVEATWDETKAVGLCLEKEIICTDPTDGDVTLESQTGSGRENDLLEIKTKQETGKLKLSACVKSSLKNKFGEFKVIIYSQYQILMFSSIINRMSYRLISYFQV